MIRRAILVAGALLSLAAPAAAQSYDYSRVHVGQLDVDQLNAISSNVGIPAGLITISFSACPVNWTEVSALNGVTVIGTLAANGNAGTGGGANTVTPTVATLTAAAQTFAGDSTAVPAEVIAWPAGVPAFAGSAGTVPAHTIAWPMATPSITWPMGVPTVSWPAGVPAFVGSAGTVPAHTITWPAGVPTISGIAATFAGSALATHAHELPFQLAAATTFRPTAAATFGTGTTRAATATQTTTANTTSAAVALSQAISAGTPAGSVTITNQGTNAWPAGVPTMGTAGFTPAGANSWPVGVPTTAWPAGVPVNAWPVGVPTMGTAAFTPAGVNTWPAGVPTNAGTTVTPVGHNAASAVTGTLNALDNRSAFLRVIFCSKN